MFFKDIIKISVRNVLRGRVRSLLTSLSITIGISSVLLVSAIGSGGEKIITREIEKLGIQGISVFQNQNQNSAPLYAEDAEKLKNRFNYIEQTLPIVLETGSLKFNNVTSDAILLGVGESAEKVYNVIILYGRTPNSSDVAAKKRVAVIDDELALKAYKRTNVVGKILTIKFNGKSEKFSIIGVIKSQKDGINQVLGNGLPDFLYLPYSTLNELRGAEDLSQIAVTCVGEYSSDGAEFADFLSKKNAAPNSYSSKNMSSKIGEIKSITGMVSLIMSAIAGISLCVAGLGIMNAMFSSTAERKEEIGVSMSVGAKSKDIMICFLTESIIIALIGGTLGALIGFSITYTISSLLNVELMFSFKTLLAAEVISFLCGGLFSVIPAVKASRLDPIVALGRG